VRQAFAKAFDRQDYVDVVLKGAGTPAFSFIPPGRPGAEESIHQSDFDAAAAKSELDAAVKADFPNGLPPIKLTFASSARQKIRMEWIQNQVKTNLGVDMQLDPVEAKAYTALTKEPATTPQIFFLGWCQDYPDPQDWLSLVFRSDSTVTHVGWKNDKFDELTKQADVEKDAAKRADLYKQAQQILTDDAPVVYLYFNVQDLLIKPYVKNLRDHITADDAAFPLPGIKNIQNIDIQR
jgi:oligopeptide transport system substrate-binding protein